MSFFLNSYVQRPDPATLAGLAELALQTLGSFRDTRITGTAGLSLDSFGILRKQEYLSGTALIKAGGLSTLKLVKIMTGAAPVALGQSAAMLQGKKMAAVDGFELAAIGAMVKPINIIGDGGLDLAVSGSMVKAKKMTGAGDCELGLSGVMVKAKKMTGAGEVTIQVAATLKKAAKAAASVAMQFGQAAGVVTPEPPPAPVAWYDLEEASPNVADGTDATGNGHDLATPDDPVGTDTGKVGAYAAVGGEDDESIMNIADHVDFRSGSLTVAGWFKVGGSASPAWTQLFAKWGGYICTFDEASDTLEFSAGGATASVACPPVNTWFFVVCQTDGSEVSVSVNAKTPGTATGAIHSAGSDFRLFSNATYHNVTYGDSVGVWQDVLSYAEILWLYNSGNGRAYADL